MDKVQERHQEEIESGNSAVSHFEGDWQLSDEGFLFAEEFEDGFGFLSIASTLQALKTVGSEGLEGLGVSVIFKFVLNLDSLVKSHVLVLASDTLLGGVVGASTEGKGELFNVEGSDLGELGCVLFIARSVEVHICLFN